MCIRDSPKIAAIGTYMRTQKEISLLSDEQKGAISQIGTTAQGSIQETFQQLAASNPELAQIPVSYTHLDVYKRQRVASPFLSTAQETLKLYKAIDPNTWGRMLGRVNGVNFTGIYGGTRAMGWQNIKLPEGYTWKEYMYFLLDTLPEETKQSYLEKLRVSREFWKYKGGCLDLSTIRKLTDLGIKFYVQKKTNYKTDKLPVQMDYLDDIDIAEFKEIPTYKRMCICILKNDHVCKYMGFALTKKEKLRRDRVMQKYKNIIR